jgi:hypothetical protein
MKTLAILVLTFGFLQISGFTQNETKTVPAWTQEQKKDPFRGDSFMLFTLEGRFLTPPQTTTLTNPVMVIRCVPGDDNKGHTKGKYISGYIATGAVVDTNVNDSGNVVIKVQFRLDDGKIQSAQWTRSTDFSSIFLKRQYAFAGSGYDDFANLLYGHMTYHKENTNPQVKKILFDVPEYLGGEVVMQFDLPDSIAVAEACGIIWHK